MNRPLLSIEREQGELNTTVETIRKALKEQERPRTNAKDFIAVTKKYTDMKELDATILREFVQRINIFHKDKETKTQRVEIIYNFIGAFDFEEFGRMTTLSKRTKNQKIIARAV